MKLFGSIVKKVTKVKTFEGRLPLSITEVIIVRCNLVNNTYQHGSRVLHMFIPSNSFGQLFEV